MSADAIARRVGWRQVCHGIPAADVTRRARKRKHGDIGVMLDDSVVNAFGTARIKGFGIWPDKGGVQHSVGHGRGKVAASRLKNNLAIQPLGL